MSKNQLSKEWAEITQYAVHNKAIALWLQARDVAFREGEATDGYTRAIRREYRQIMRGLYPQAA